MWVLKIWKRAQSRFVIYGMGRSGSTLRTSLINSNPLVFCDSEVISHNTVHRLLFPYVYLNAISKKISPPVKIYGCCIMSYLLQHQKIKDQNIFFKKIVNKGWKIIHIRRDDILNVAVSIILAQYDDIWEVKKKSINRTSKAYVPIAEFCKYVRILQPSYKLEDIALKDIPHLRVNYENNLEKGNRKPIMDKIFSYLGIDSCKIKTELKKNQKA